MDKIQNYENVLSVLCLMEDCGITRKDIADSLGISIKSAGNLVLSMISHGIITEHKKKTNEPGRRAGALAPSAEPVFAVSHIMHDAIITDYFGYNLKIAMTEVWEIDDHLFLDDVFSSYFRHLAGRRPALCGICLVSDGIQGSGTFTNSEIAALNAISFKALAEEYISGALLMLDNRYTAAIKPTSGIDVIFTDEYLSPRVYVLNDGVLLNNRTIGVSYGFYHHINDRTFSAAYRYSSDNNEYARCIAEIICDVINIISPERIFIKSGRYSHAGPVITKIYESLSLDYRIPDAALPRIISTGDEFDLSLPFLRGLLRRKYVESVNFSSCEK